MAVQIGVAVAGEPAWASERGCIPDGGSQLLPCEPPRPQSRVGAANPSRERFILIARRVHRRARKSPPRTLHRRAFMLAAGTSHRGSVTRRSASRAAGTEERKGKGNGASESHDCEPTVAQCPRHLKSMPA